MNESCNVLLVQTKITVVYFDQRLDAAHPQHWLKYALQCISCQKAEKRKKKQENRGKIKLKNVFFELAHKQWLRVKKSKHVNKLQHMRIHQKCRL